MNVSKNNKVILTYLSSLIILALVFFLLFSLNSKIHNLEQDNTEEMPLLNDEDTDASPILGHSQSTTFGTHIQELSIGQQLPYFSNDILRATQADLHHLPQHIAFPPHPENENIITIGITLNNTGNIGNSHLTGDWLTVIGATIDTIQLAHGNTYYYIKLSEVTEKVIVSIDGLKPITLIEMEPLDYWIAETSFNHALLNKEKVYGDYPRLFLAKGATAFDIKFGEAMITINDIGKQHKDTPGEWLSEDTYRFFFDYQQGTSFSLQGFYSLRGNQPLHKDQYIYVNHRDYQMWINGWTGEKLDVIQRSNIYDALLFSPSHQHYIGVTINRPDGDGRGMIYSLTLEKHGEEQIKIEENLYTHIIQNQLPAVWLSSKSFIYFTGHSIKIFDLVEESTTTLYESDDWLHTAYVDVNHNMLYFYEPVKENDNDWHYASMTFHVYNLKTGEHFINERYTSIVMPGDITYYYNQLMNIDQLGDKLLVTYQAEDGSYYTRVYDGKELTELQGALMYVFKKGIVIREVIFDYSESSVIQTHYWWDGKSKPILLDEVGSEHNNYRQVGDFLIRTFYINGEHHYQVWVPELKEWIEVKNIEDYWLSPLPSWPYIPDTSYTKQMQEIINASLVD